MTINHVPNKAKIPTTIRYPTYFEITPQPSYPWFFHESMPLEIQCKIMALLTLENLRALSQTNRTTRKKLFAFLKKQKISELQIYHSCFTAALQRKKAKPLAQPLHEPSIQKCHSPSTLNKESLAQSAFRNCLHILETPKALHITHWKDLLHLKLTFVRGAYHIRDTQLRPNRHLANAASFMRWIIQKQSCEQQRARLFEKLGWKQEAHELIESMSDTQKKATTFIEIAKDRIKNKDIATTKKFLHLGTQTTEILANEWSKFILLKNIAEGYGCIGDNVSTKHILQKASILIQKINNPHLQAIGKKSLALIEVQIGCIEAARLTIQPLNTNLQSVVLRKIANKYAEMNNVKKSAATTLEIPDSYYRALSCIDIADILIRYKNYTKAKTMLKKAKKLLSSFSKAYISIALTDIARLEASLGNVKAAKQTSLSLPHYHDQNYALKEIALVQCKQGKVKEAYKTALEMHSINLKAMTLQAIAIYYAKRREYHRAETIIKTIPFSYYQSIAWEKISKIYCKTKQLSQAQKSLLYAQNSAHTMTDGPSKLMRIGSLALKHINLGNTKIAHTLFLQMYQNVNQTMNQEQSMKPNILLHQSYTASEKLQQIVITQTKSRYFAQAQQNATLLHPNIQTRALNSMLERLVQTLLKASYLDIQKPW